MTTRMLNIKNGHNFRELGGYQTQDGHHLKYHKVVRSGHLCDLSAADQTYLNYYGVFQDIDFRSSAEVKDGPDRVPSQAEYIFNPVFSEDETHSTEDAEKLANELNENPHVGYQRMVDAYHNLVTDAHAIKAYQRFFELLLANDQPDQAILFHCTGGKDRTGMGAYFLLNALGVDQATIRQDYLMTNEVTKDFLDDFLASLKKKGHNSISIENSRAFWVVDPGYLAQAEADIKAMSGNVHNYLKYELNVNDNDLADLRKIYLTD